MAMIDALKPPLVFVAALLILVWVGIELARRAFQFERKSELLASLPVFFWRVATSIALALVLILGTLSIGMLVYYYLTPTHTFAIAFHRASMILSGMGPVESDEKNLTDCERYFAGAYSLFSGFVLVTVIGLILTPIFHRVLHHFHIDDEKAPQRYRAKSKSRTASRR
jgi:putative Mn2+ efflux pump MntP